MSRLLKCLTIILQLLPFILAFTFSIKIIHEPDTFWQLATGNWIIENGKIPTTDIYSYTHSGTNWVNVKWGYEVIISFITKISSIELIPIFQILVLTLIVIILKQWSKRLVLPLLAWHTNVIHICILIAITTASFRFNNRPEIISMLFTLLTVYVLNYAKNNIKLWLSIFCTQVLWTNLHEAFGIGPVLIGIYCLGEWIEYNFTKNLAELEKAKKLSIAFFLSLIGICINPYGISLLFKPLDIFTQLNLNKFTDELNDYTSYTYWQPQAYLTLIELTIVLFGATLIFLTNKNKNKLNTLITSIGIGNVLVLVSIVFLAKSAFRNLAFLDLILTPYLAFVVINLIRKFSINAIKSNWLTTSFGLIIGVLLISFTINNKLYAKLNLRETSGLGVSIKQNPVGASEFIKQHHLEDLRFYTDYLSSSYLIQSLNDKYKTFIDLRDLDIFPDTFMRYNAEISSIYSEFQKADSVYQFDGCIVLNATYSYLTKQLYQDTNYYVAYFDPLSTIFLKKRHLKQIKPASEISIPLSLPISPISKIINFTLNTSIESAELFKDKAIEEQLYFANIGDIDKAYKLVSKQTVSNSLLTSDQNMIVGIYYFNNASKNQTYIDSAGIFLNLAISQDATLFNAIYILGLIDFSNNDLLSAAKKFEQVCELNNQYLSAFLYAGECYKQLFESTKTNKKYLAGYIKYTKIANQIEPGNPDIIWNLGMAYFYDKNYTKAETFLTQSLSFNNYLSEEDINLAKSCLKTIERN